jgi:hypothetical protein
MRYMGLAVVAGLFLFGCSSADKPRPMLMTPQSRLIYHDGTYGLWTLCDRGHRVYMTHAGLFQVVANACPDGQP